MALIRLGLSRRANCIHVLHHSLPRQVTASSSKTSKCVRAHAHTSTSMHNTWRTFDQACFLLGNPALGSGRVRQLPLCDTQANTSPATLSASTCPQPVQAASCMPVSSPCLVALPPPAARAASCRPETSAC